MRNTSPFNYESFNEPSANAAAQCADVHYRYNLASPAPPRPAEHEKLGFVEDFALFRLKSLLAWTWLDVGGYSGFAGDIDY